MAPTVSNIEARPRVAMLALGSNVGDREAHLRRGLAAIEARGAIRVEAVSSLYASDPVDCAGGEFLNAVARVTLLVSARDLLAAIADAERAEGRTGSRGDARPLDIDLLYDDDRRVLEPGLEVPHPRRLERPFVLAPLGEVCADLSDPVTGRRVADEVAARGGAAGAVRRKAGPEWWTGGIDR
jgi:2-amino-4-hydroxy-6-hydroxymethyldihydropteridine diphosphokinase